MNNTAFYGAALSQCGGDIRENIISGNHAYTGGGFYKCNATISFNDIFGNTVTQRGGALYDCDGKIERNFMNGNKAIWDGGALSNCDGHIYGNIIKGNIAEYNGGGLWECNALIQNNIVFGNFANRGGGLACCNGVIHNNTIFGNTAKDFGNGSVYGGGLASCQAPIKNCIIWQNTSVMGEQLYNCLLPLYSCIQDWSGGVGNISEYPLFVDPVNDNFHLQDASPCIDAGGIIDLSEDFEGDTKPFDSCPYPRGDGSDFDIGADEFIGIMPTPTSFPSPTPTPEPGPCRVHVPGEFSSIQAAIDHVDEGCEIVVSPGTYYENISFKGKNIILRSREPENSGIAENTIIDGQQKGSVVSFSGLENEDCIISGFTITNGSSQYGGGISGYGTLATIRNNLIKENEIYNVGYKSQGGGIYWCNGSIVKNKIIRNTAFYGAGLTKCDGVIQNNLISGNQAYSGGGLNKCNAIISNNVISGNTVSERGGGLYYCDGEILDNIISSNIAPWDGGGMAYCDALISNNIIKNNRVTMNGGALYECKAIIQNNIIFGNRASRGGGLAFCEGVIFNNTIYGNTAEIQGTGDSYGGGICSCKGEIRNCIVWQNTAPKGAQIYNPSPDPSYSCIQEWSGGGIGNITSNPLLVDPVNGDFHLQPESPCVDAGGMVDLTKDFEGDPRPYNAYPYPRGDGSDFDIGADEYSIPIPCYNVRAIIKIPQSGHSVSGNYVHIEAELENGFIKHVSKILFQYRIPSGSGSWEDIVAANPNHPNPDTSFPWFVHWDTTEFTEEPCDLRAIAYDLCEMPDSSPSFITVVINHKEPDTKGYLSKVGENIQEIILSNMRENIIGSGNTEQSYSARVSLIASELKSQTFCHIKWLDGNVSKYSLKSHINLGTIIDVSLSNGLVGLENPVKITFTYPDGDQDGLIDNTTFLETSLCVLYLDENNGMMKEIPGIIVDTYVKQVRVEVFKLGVYGLYIKENLSVDDWIIYND